MKVFVYSFSCLLSLILLLNSLNVSASETAILKDNTNEAYISRQYVDFFEDVSVALNISDILEFEKIKFFLNQILHQILSTQI